MRNTKKQTKVYDVTAFVGFYIEAESEEEAKEKAYNKLILLGKNDVEWEVLAEKEDE